jgi:drug/metabolite transporter (DMT)-like permease
MKRLSIFVGLLAGLLFGVATPFSKMLLKELNTFQLAGLLYLGAALAMIPSAIKNKNQIRRLFEPDAVYKTIGIVFFGGFLGPLLLLLGLNAAKASSVSIWLNMELVATAVLGVVFFKDSIDKKTWIAVVLTLLAGIATTFVEGISGFSSALLITAACFCWGMDNHLTALTDGAPPQVVTFLKGIVAGSVNCLIGCLISDQSPSVNFLVIALIVGSFSYGISIVLYVTSAQSLGATRSQILFSTAPLWGVILSYVFLHDPFQWVHLLSLALLAIAVAMTGLLTHGHLHSHADVEHIHYHKHDDGHHNHLHSAIPSNTWHAHSHVHEPMTHEHPHFPDLHHRHKHK